MEIVYADPRIVVAVKPAGVLSTDEPGGMPQLLRQELGTPCIRTVHRLDAAVSGLMVYARGRPRRPPCCRSSSAAVPSARSIWRWSTACRRGA